MKEFKSSVKWRSLSGDSLCHISSPPLIMEGLDEVSKKTTFQFLLYGWKYLYIHHGAYLLNRCAISAHHMVKGALIMF